MIRNSDFNSFHFIHHDYLVHSGSLMSRLSICSRNCPLFNRIQHCCCDKNIDSLEGILYHVCTSLTHSLTIEWLCICEWVSDYTLSLICLIIIHTQFNYKHLSTHEHSIWSATRGSRIFGFTYFAAYLSGARHTHFDSIDYVFKYLRAWMLCACQLHIVCVNLFMDLSLRKD